MSNDDPPRACLADFSLVTTILNPDQKLSCSEQLTGGTTKFKSPELLVPGAFGRGDATPTPQSDIYAFGLVIFQVRRQDLVSMYWLFLCVLSSDPQGRIPIS